jgi:hypothetical protein
VYYNSCIFFLAQPHIRVWNSVSLATVVVLGLGEFERSISCLSFSKAVIFTIGVFTVNTTTLIVMMIFLYRTAVVCCARSTKGTTITYPFGTGRRTKRVTRSRRPRCLETFVEKYCCIIIISPSPETNDCLYFFFCK